MYFTADYIFPVSSPPLKNGVLVVDDSGIIIDVLTKIENKKLEKFSGILCPGFVNAHCHLELSYLKGKISERKGLADFIGEIEMIRGNFSEKEIQNSIVKAENEMLKNGVVAVGDVCNSDFSFKQKSKQNLKYHSFIEALGFHSAKKDLAFEKCLTLFHQSAIYNLQSSITPHAPYSASVKLLKKINDFAKKNKSIISIHNQECEEENKMFFEGKGKILERLQLLGIDVSDWKPTGKSSLQSVLPHLSDCKKILLVHNTFTTKKDIEFIKTKNTNPKTQIYFCFCPNANLYIENRLPDIKMFINESCVIGTDSLSSNHALSILEEIKTISTHFPEISLQTLLTWATKNGAEFFGLENQTFEKGKQPGINLIKNIDLINLKLTKESVVEKIY